MTQTNFNHSPAYPFKEGETYFTIEKCEVIESTWDYISEQMRDENPDREYFKSYEQAEIKLNL